MGTRHYWRNPTYHADLEIPNSGKEKKMTDEQQAQPDVEEVELAEAHDETDVPAALDRNTDDGKGGAVVPKSDFDSYDAGEGVTAYHPEDNS
jgi:hypothetical protein